MFPINLLIPLLIPLVALARELPLWVTVSGLFFIFWRILIDLFHWKRPSRKLTGFLALIYLLIVAFSFEALIGREPAGSFLFILTGLKILEYEEQKESLFLCMLGLFLVCTYFLFDLDFFVAVPMSVVLLYLTYMLLPSTYRHETQYQPRRFYFLTVLASLPLTLFLFFFFPRFSEILWGLNKSQNPRWATTGFSDELKPGSISEVIQSTRPVFRAEFFKNRPALSDLYWRGEVLTEPIEMAWKKNHFRKDNLTRVEKMSDPDFKVLLEPHGQRWIYSPDNTQSLYTDTGMYYDPEIKIYKLARPVDKIQEYVGRMGAVEPPESSTNQDTYLKTQINSTAILNLIQSWKMDPATPEKKVETILQFFQQQKFTYTLSPGGTDPLTLEKFLFETKKGFCEHYASAMTHMLRLLKVPSRIVVGFHGGVYNQYGQFWLVREKEAHAWVEYLNSKNQWTRTDPTSVIAPLRLQLGAEEFFALPPEVQSLAALSAPLQFLRPSSSFYQQAYYMLQGFNYRWTTWLMNFDLDKQKQLLSQGPFQKEVLIILSLFLAIGLFFWIQRIFSSLNRSSSGLEDIYLRKLLNHPRFQSLQTEVYWGPLELQKQLQNRAPEQAAYLEKFFHLYIQISYMKKSESEKKNLLNQLKKVFQSRNIQLSS